MMDQKTWGWIKVLGGAVALYWAWNAGIGMNITGSVAILAVLMLIGGALKAMSKGR